MTKILNSSGDTILSGGSGRRVRRTHPGLTQVLDEIRGMIETYAGSEIIRKKALSITSAIPRHIRTALPDSRNRTAIITAVYNWMNRNIRYVFDPVGIEYLQTPERVLKSGAGDCDDHAALAGALLQSVGIPVKLKVAKTDKNNPNAYSHIYLLVQNEAGEWMPFDTTIHAGAGKEATNLGYTTINVNDMTRKRYLLGVVDPATAATVASTTASIYSKITGLFGGESDNDKKKQAIQKELRKMGFTGFNKMSGFKGKEGDKLYAMELIYTILVNDPAAASDIESYLVGGQITPETVVSLENEYGSILSGRQTGNTGGNSGQASNSGTNNKPATTQTPVVQAGGGKVQMILLGLAVAGYAGYAYMNRKS